MQLYRGVIREHQSDIEVACHINKTADTCSKLSPLYSALKLYAAVPVLPSLALGMEQSLPDTGN
jgi:hypothetical protein